MTAATAGQMARDQRHDTFLNRFPALTNGGLSKCLRMKLSENYEKLECCVIMVISLVYNFTVHWSLEVNLYFVIRNLRGASTVKILTGDR